MLYGSVETTAQQSFTEDRREALYTSFADHEASQAIRLTDLQATYAGWQVLETIFMVTMQAAQTSIAPAPRLLSSVMFH
jgi:hypothetical protein